MMFRLPALLPVLLLTACNSADDAAPAATASVAAAPGPALPAGTTAPAPGEWQVTEDGAGVRASFQSPEGKSLLSLTCDMATRAVTMAVASGAPGNQAFVLQAGGTAARLDTVADNNAADPHQAAAIAPDAPVFVGFVQPGGMIDVSQPGGMSLRIPSDSGIGRVFEGCRS
jgi:hypothetical protein